MRSSGVPDGRQFLHVRYAPQPQQTAGDIGTVPALCRKQRAAGQIAEREITYLPPVRLVRGLRASVGIELWCALRGARFTRPGQPVQYGVPAVWIILNDSQYGLIEGQGWVAAQAIHTAATCGTFRLDMVVENGKAVHRMGASRETARVINEVGEPCMREACTGALEKAGIRAEDLACMVTNTPTAWYASFAAKVLGIPRDRIVSTYERFANTGPVLIPMNLYESVRQGKLRDGDWVLLYAIGSVSTAVATVMRWSDTSLGAV